MFGTGTLFHCVCAGMDAAGGAGTEGDGTAGTETAGGETTGTWFGACPTATAEKTSDETRLITERGGIIRQAVIRSFLRDRDVMWMTLLD